MDITLREMTIQDTSKVSDILCACYRFIAQPDGISLQQLQLLIDQRGSEAAVRDQFVEYRSTVACLGKIIVGIVATKEGEITKLYVDPLHLRLGVGTALFKEVEKVLSREGFKTLTLGTTGYGVSFYRAMGMSIVGRKTCAHGPLEGNHVVLMEKKLFWP